MFHKTHEASDKGQEGGPFESDRNPHTTDDIRFRHRKKPCPEAIGNQPTENDCNIRQDAETAWLWSSEPEIRTSEPLGETWRLEKEEREYLSVGVFLEQSKGQGVVASSSRQKSRHLTNDSTSHAVLLPLCWPPANPLVLLISVSPLPDAAVCTKETIRTFAVDKCVL